MSKVLGFMTDTGWNPATAMRALPEKVFNGELHGRQNIQKVVDKHLQDGSIFPVAGMKGHTEIQEEST